MGSTWSRDTSVEVFSDLFPHISLDQLFSIHGLHSQTLSLCLYPEGFPDSLNFQGRASEWVGDEEERSPPGQPQAPGLTPASHQVLGNLAVQQASSETCPSEGTGHPEARYRQEKHQRKRVNSVRKLS